MKKKGATPKTWWLNTFLWGSAARWRKWTAKTWRRKICIRGSPRDRKLYHPCDCVITTLEPTPNVIFSNPVRIQQFEINVYIDECNSFVGKCARSDLTYSQDWSIVGKKSWQSKCVVSISDVFRREDLGINNWSLNLVPCALVLGANATCYFLFIPSMFCTDNQKPNMLLRSSFQLLPGPSGIRPQTAQYQTEMQAAKGRQRRSSSNGNILKTHWGRHGNEKLSTGNEKESTARVVCNKNGIKSSSPLASWMKGWLAS